MNRITEEQLTEWEAMANVAIDGTWTDWENLADVALEAVPALVAEVRRLRDGLERMARVFGDDQAGVWLAHLKRELETALVKRPMDPMHWPTFATGLSFGYVSGMVVAMVTALLTGQSFEGLSDLPGMEDRDET